MKKLSVLLGVLVVFLAQPGLRAAPIEFQATLSGAQEVPSRVTPASGLATFSLDPTHTVLSYELSVFDIENVVAAHIHLAPVGVNGPVIAFLFGPAPAGGGAFSGLLASGNIVEADLLGPLAGNPFSDFLAEIIAGNAYVNVHTNDGVAPIDTGPGDFPGGEIRGQISVVPEPPTLALLALAFGAIYVTSRRRREPVRVGL